MGKKQQEVVVNKKEQLEAAVKEYKKFSEENKFNLRDYCSPLRNQVILDITPKLAKTDLVIITDEKDNPDIKRDIFSVVECVGPQVEGIKSGDFIILRPDVMAPILNLMGRKYCQVTEFDILDVVTPELVEMDREYKKAKAIKKSLLIPTKPVQSIIKNN